MEVEVEVSHWRRRGEKERRREGEKERRSSLPKSSDASQSPDTWFPHCRRRQEMQSFLMGQDEMIGLIRKA